MLKPPTPSGEQDHHREANWRMEEADRRILAERERAWLALVAEEEHAARGQEYDAQRASARSARAVRSASLTAEERMRFAREHAAERREVQAEAERVRILGWAARRLNGEVISEEQQENERRAEAGDETSSSDEAADAPPVTASRPPVEPYRWGVTVNVAVAQTRTYNGPTRAEFKTVGLTPSSLCASSRRSLPSVSRSATIGSTRTTSALQTMKP